jgi:hypothetical protein
MLHGTNWDPTKEWEPLEGVEATMGMEVNPPIYTPHPRMTGSAWGEGP